MENGAHPARIEIDLDQFRRNLAIVRKHIGNNLFCLPVKANAYGHGLSKMSQVAVEAGVDCLGVSCLREGVRLRKAGIRIPILVLGAIHEDQVEDLIAYDLEFTISSRFKADLVAKKKSSRKCRVHIEVETGMQRTGVRPSTAVELFHHLQSLGCFDIVGVYSHLATGENGNDPIALKQLATFKQLLQTPPFLGQNLISHISNSLGVMHFASDEERQMVRPGLVAFGYLPENAPASWQGIAPCFSLKASVSYFKVVEKGEGVGYGHTYTTKDRTRIVTVPIGYGDGYRRALSNKGSVLIRGKKFPIAGMICMDQFMVDVGDHEVYVGDEVVLIGKQGKEEIRLIEMAKQLDTIPYEVLCLFNERIPRVYL